jgi:peptide/nickel transport system substrate-binding protein
MKITAPVVLVLAVSLFAGCANSTVAPHVLRLSDGTGDYTLDPYFATDQESFDLAALTMASLVRWDDGSESFRPEMLTVLPSRANGGVSRDFRHIVLHLRPNMRWSDGAPLTSRDVVFTAHAVTDPGGGAIFRDGWNDLRSIKALDATTVQMETISTDANFLHRRLFGYMRFILPEHLLAGVALNHSSYNRMPVGAGPFRYVRVDPGTAIVLEANPTYFRAPPKLHRIVVRILPDANTTLVQMRTGDLDMIANLSAEADSAARALTNVRIAGLSTYATVRVVFNRDSPTVGDQRVREALRYATDRRTIAAKVYHGIGAIFEALFVPEDAMHAELHFVEYDPARAARALERAGWRPGPDGVRMKGGTRLTFSLIAPSKDLRLDAAIEIMRADWAKIGAAVQVQRIPFQEMLVPDGRVARGHFDAVIIPYGTASMWFDNQWGCAEFPPRGLNLARFCDRGVEERVALLRRTDDRVARARIFSEIQRIIDQRVPMIILVQPPNLYVFGPRVRGVHMNPWSIFERFSEADAP